MLWRWHSKIILMSNVLKSNVVSIGRISRSDFFLALFLLRQQKAFLLGNRCQQVRILLTGERGIQNKPLMIFAVKGWIETRRCPTSSRALYTCIRPCASHLFFFQKTGRIIYTLVTRTFFFFNPSRFNAPNRVTC